ncbi:MAG TPA: hypothetical protein VFV14_04950 [Myxococcaceae bacterium]|nr:hypothetical protein [Myxococcaceae bacterium]
MADKARRVDYFYAEVADQPGEGARIFQKLKEAGVNLLSFNAFPGVANKAQIDFVPESSEVFIKAAKAAGITLSAKKQALYVQGADRVGAAAEILKRLADAKINVRAASGCAAADKGFGVIIWVRPEDFQAAAKALGA